MTKLIQGLNVKDELNLYLVSNKLKPASSIYLNPLFFDNKYNINKFGITRIKLDDKDTEIFENILNRLVKDYEFNKNRIEIRYNNKGLKVKVESKEFYVAKDKDSLMNLLFSASDKKRGLAYGYPKEAVNNLYNTIGNETINARYFTNCLKKAKKSNKEIPLWIAYISHIPEKLDIVNNNISESSRKLGEKYMNYVRNNNPDLADRVENDFKSFNNKLNN